MFAITLPTTRVWASVSVGMAAAAIAAVCRRGGAVVTRGAAARAGAAALVPAAAAAAAVVSAGGGARWVSGAASSTVTVDDGELAKFTAVASQWWNDMGGPFAGLHAMNAVRVPFIVDAVRENAGGAGAGAGAARVPRPLAGLTVVDVGCGGGILAEPLARLGGKVLGIDAGADNIAAATAHARHDPGLAGKLEYATTTAESLAASGATFDVVVSSEVLEHVADTTAFLTALAQLTKPGGVIVLTTINRTSPSFLGAIIGAEYVARIVPAGTHEWVKFVTPDELKGALLSAGAVTFAETGMVYNPLSRAWGTCSNMNINYGVAARKLA